MQISRGTTQTIGFRLKNIDVGDIAVAYITITQDNTLVIEKSGAELFIDSENRTITAELSQEDTLLLSDKSFFTVQLRFRLNDGSAFATSVRKFDVGEILKEGEI